MIPRMFNGQRPNKRSSTSYGGVTSAGLGTVVSNNNRVKKGLPYTGIPKNEGNTIDLSRRNIPERRHIFSPKERAMNQRIAAERRFTNQQGASNRQFLSRATAMDRQSDANDNRYGNMSVPIKEPTEKPSIFKGIGSVPENIFVNNIPEADSYIQKSAVSSGLPTPTQTALSYLPVGGDYLVGVGNSNITPNPYYQNNRLYNQRMSIFNNPVSWFGV